MGSLNLVLFSLIIISLINLTTAQYCYSTGNFTTNSTYGTNRNLILSSLPSSVTANGGFYTATIGHDSDKVYALALCRGDLSIETCYNCINKSSQEIIKGCPYQNEAVTWGDHQCIVRCSNRDIFGTMETRPAATIWNLNNVSMNVDEFNQDLASLMDSLVTRAAMGSSRLKFATEEANLTNSQKLYALVQCTPDLSQSNCSDCLRDAVSLLKNYYGKQGVGILGPSCIIGYDLYRFYESTADAPPPPPPPPTPTYVPPPTPANVPPPPSTNTTITKDSRTGRSRTVVIVVPTAILLTLIVLTCAIFWIRRPKGDVEYDEDATKSMEQSLQFDFSTLRAATNDFSDANKLGQGGFGSVYKGRLPNGQEIAVKRLAVSSTQGEVEFKNEIVLMARLQHRNLVRLLGCCLEGRERLLIYEFLPNASLDRFIFDPIKRARLDWEMRYKIIGGIARGILYLHEDSRLRIIHHDLKAGNVLLDAKMNPKISDFGTARLFAVDQSQGNTRRIAGTFGYMAPEYAKLGKFSVKTDVFSFGVLILEIVSGKKNSCFRNPEHVEHLVSYAWKNWRKGTALKLVDPTLTSGSRNEIMRCIHIGLLCVQENARDRPTMASVVIMLNSYTQSLPLPSQPAFLMHSSTDMPLREHTGSDQSTYLSVRVSVNEASFTELYPR